MPTGLKVFADWLATRYVKVIFYSITTELISECALALPLFYKYWFGLQDIIPYWTAHCDVSLRTDN